MSTITSQENTLEKAENEYLIRRFVCAIKSNDIEEVRSFLKNDEVKNNIIKALIFQNQRMEHPLTLAIRLGVDVEILELLLDAGAKIDKNYLVTTALGKTDEMNALNYAIEVSKDADDNNFVKNSKYLLRRLLQENPQKRICDFRNSKGQNIFDCHETFLLQKFFDDEESLQQLKDKSFVPSFLLCEKSDEVSDGSISPFARLSPSDAVSEGGAWKSSISPKSQRQKKSVVIDHSFLYDEVLEKESEDKQGVILESNSLRGEAKTLSAEEKRKVAQIKAMIKEGFDVFLYCNNNIVKVIGVEERGGGVLFKCDLKKELESKAFTAEDKHFKILAQKFGIAKDDAAILDSSRRKELETLFCSQADVLSMRKNDEGKFDSFKLDLGFYDDIALGVDCPIYRIRNFMEVKDYSPNNYIIASMCNNQSYIDYVRANYSSEIASMSTDKKIELGKVRNIGRLKLENKVVAEEGSQKDLTKVSLQTFERAFVDKRINEARYLIETDEVYFAGKEKIIPLKNVFLALLHHKDHQLLYEIIKCDGDASKIFVVLILSGNFNVAKILLDDDLCKKDDVFGLLLEQLKANRVKSDQKYDIIKFILEDDNVVIKNKEILISIKELLLLCCEKDNESNISWFLEHYLDDDFYNKLINYVIEKFDKEVIVIDAINKMFFKTAQSLIDAGAKIDIDKCYAQYLSSVNLSDDIISGIGNSIMRPISTRYFEALAFFIKNGANESSMARAMELSVKMGNVEAVRMILASDFPIDYQNEQGDTVLMMAARSNKETIYHFLLEFGADAKIKNNKGETAANIMSHAIARANSQASQQEQNDLYLATNEDGRSVGNGTSGSGAVFDMSKVGEILNHGRVSCAHRPRIKLDINDIIDGRRAKIRNKEAQYLDKDEIVLLQDDYKDKVNQFKTKNEALYCQMSFRTDSVGDVKLPSMNLSNKIAAIKVPANVKIENIFIDEFGFYHVKTDVQCVIEYVLQLDVSKQEISKQNPVKDFLDEYFENTSDRDDLISVEDFETRKEFLEEVFARGYKAEEIPCGIRAEAFVNKLREELGDDYLKYCHVVAIDGNHVAIEIFDGGAWKYIELGGANAVFNVSDKEYHKKVSVEKDEVVEAVEQALDEKKDVAKFLQERGFDIYDEENRSLFYVVRKGYVEAAKSLCKAGVKASLKDLILYAIESKNLELVKFFAEQNKEIIDKDIILHAAFYSDSLKITKFLWVEAKRLHQEKGLNLSDDFSGLFYDITSQHSIKPEIKEFFLEEIIANFNSVGEYDIELIGAIVLQGNPRLLNLLIAKGFDIKKLDTKKQFGLLLNAIKSKNLAIVELLVESGLDVYNFYANSTRRIIDYAILNPNLNNSTKKFLAEIKDESEQNCLMRAIINDRNDLAVSLVAAGVNVNHVDKNNTSALLLACASNQLDINIINIILQSGANSNLEDTNGYTALINIVISKDPLSLECARLLIDNGADFEKKNKFGFSALDYARHQQNTELLKIFAEARKPKIEDKPKASDFAKKVQMEDGLTKYAYRVTAPLTPESVKLPEDLASLLLTRKSPSLFIVKDGIEKNVNELIKISKQQSTGRPVFYIDNPSKIDVLKKTLKINKDYSVAVDNKGFLADFLEEAKKYNQSGDYDDCDSPVLIINWSAFSASQRVALNTMLDERPSVSGEKFSDIKVISICDSLSQDRSFISRHKEVYNLNMVTQDSGVKATEDVIEIDLEGFDDWKQKLFGEIYLENNQIKWKKSDFVKRLELNPDAVFRISNCSNKKDFEYFLNQSKALGYFFYNGYKIELGQDFWCKINEKNFDFDKFFHGQDKIKIAENFNIDEVPQHCAIINPQLFDSLIFDKKIIDGKYQELEGLIKEAAKKPQKILQIFISGSLTEAQYYCLLNQASQQQVELQIYLAPNVKIPQKLEQFLSEDLEKFVDGKNLKAGIIFTNNCRAATNKVREHLQKKSDKKILIVDVEDCSYQDLIKMINFKINGDKFEDFQESKSKFLELLESGQNIILRGNFSPALLQMLESDLCRQGADNLMLIVEDKNNSLPKKLQWIGKKNYSILSEKISAQEEKIIFESSDPSIDAESFIANRKSIFEESLQQNSMVSLVGKSGIGKTSLLQQYKNVPGYCVYNDLDQLENWAQDSGKDRKKILVIDEANIINSHLKVFEPLKRGGNKTIFYRGKFYELDGNHKVVFMSNPKEFGGGRASQALFEDNEIAQFKMQELPANYIYYLLEKDIFDKIDSSYQSAELKRGFAEFCKKEIAKYQQVLGRDNEITIRELQSYALIYLANEIDKHKPADKIKSDKFVSTDATATFEKAIANCLNVRQKQCAGILPITGTAGVLIEGAVGIGKSSMIEAYLEKNNVEYIKIDSSTTDPERLIIEAYEQGKAIMIDEIDSCIKSGIERSLNFVLSGVHPTKPDFKAKAGCVLFATANGMDLEGRAMIGGAVRHRLNCPVAADLQHYKEEDIIEIIALWCKIEVDEAKQIPKITEIADDFAALPLEHKINIRELKDYVCQQKELAQYFSERKRPSKAVENPQFLQLRDSGVVAEVWA